MFISCPFKGTVIEKPSIGTQKTNETNVSDASSQEVVLDAQRM